MVRRRAAARARLEAAHVGDDAAGDALTGDGRRGTIAPMLHAVTVRPVRLREHVAELGCDRLRGIGYAWRCTCGSAGPIMRSHRVARDAGRTHAEAQNSVSA